MKYYWIIRHENLRWERQPNKQWIQRALPEWKVGMPNKFLLSFLWPTFDTIIYIRGSYNQFNTGSFLWWRWWCHAESFADGPSPYIVWRPSHSECHQEEEEEAEGYFISFPVLVKFPENARSGEGAQTLLTFHSFPSRECDKLHLNCKLRGCNLSAQLSQSLSQWVKVSGISNSSSSASWKKSVPEFINTSVVRWDEDIAKPFQISSLSANIY